VIFHFTVGSAMRAGVVAQVSCVPGQKRWQEMKNTWGVFSWRWKAGGFRGGKRRARYAAVGSGLK